MTVDGTVTEMSDSYLNVSPRPQVRTSRAGGMAKGSFRRIRSENRDAPRTGRGTSLSRVTLEDGQMDPIDTEEDRDHRLPERAQQGIQKAGCGDLGVLVLAAADINN